MLLTKYVLVHTWAIWLSCLHLTKADQEVQAVGKILSQCKKKSPHFDSCMKRAFNELRPFFKRGIPELGVAPFDPHFARQVKQKRSFFGLQYTLILRNVYERGWTQSTVTNFTTDRDNANIIYSQYFPEKSLDGQYEFKSDMLGESLERAGGWNMTLRDYSQTTRVRRRGRGAGAGLDVRVEIDHIGDMDLHIGNLLKGKTTLERWLDSLINASWKPGFVVVRPAINDLVSTAFTNIWSKSFKKVHIEDFFTD
uniref:Takeout Protein n=1 Tax=Epiphyas postvittana TaxID=65032 RepID=A0A0K8TUQ1_EPIPO